MNLSLFEHFRWTKLGEACFLARSFLFFLSPWQRYLAFLSLMLGIHAWIRFFLEPTEAALLALILIHGAVIWFWLYQIRLWQPYHPKCLLALNPACHLYWYQLEPITRDALAAQISELSRDMEAYPEAAQIEPFYTQVVQADHIDEKIHPLVSRSKVAVFTFAGGQATRLGKGSKATLVLENELMGSFSLLSYQARYFKGLQDRDIKPFWAILTSPSNHEAIEAHLKEHQFFGLDSSRVDCICQRDLPLLDENGRLWLHQKGYFLQGPSGNGCAFAYLRESGVLSKWQRAGIELVTLNLIDNPLAYPFDYALIETAYQNPHGYSVAVVEKVDPVEKVGVFASVRLKGESGWRARIVEYSDLGFELAQESELLENEGSKLVYRFASTGVMALSFENLSRLSLVDSNEKGWHLAHKYYEVDEGIKVETLKRETFIFDLLAHEEIEEPSLVCYSRQEFFAPIKSPDDIAKTAQAVLKRDLERLKRCRKTSEAISFENLWSIFKGP